MTDLYLARHAEALPDESGLTDRGRDQAARLGQRLKEIPFTTIHHSPLPRAVQTARLLNHQAPLQASEEAGDHIPYVPLRNELPTDSADYYLDFLHQATPEELAQGPHIAERAVARFTGPSTSNHELLITHNFLIAWLVRDALDAPPWRWLTLNHSNCGLTVIRYTPNRPAALLMFNDESHLPAGIPS
ncbi:histidine phosphatase family protein [Kribbella antibiotica]|uniref:Histidine phosphatase family protein n=1 Tax=Kribbella antibiotica TaxID=190195 RepID=A0A4R4ZJ61_9ACTN|nr:histidine phosphatase family protein [Kribbella antibiotica]TDD58781.1 histidine phosphatase family protein [Kribbella antibiotica]